MVLERWIIELGDPSTLAARDLQDPLPNVYKKAVVLFRSLFTMARFLPAWKFYRRIAKQPANHTALKPKYRISTSATLSARQDPLDFGLYPTADPVSELYQFKASNSPAGPLCVQVKYRLNCEFRIDDAEALLSSHFMGLDEHYFEPSLRTGGRGTNAVPGSLPDNSNQLHEVPDRSQAYGSMSTFHQVGPQAGTSPMTALRANTVDPSSSPLDSPPQRIPPNHRVVQGSKSSLRSTESSPTYQRRTSVSFQPFKAGALASSPATAPQVLTSPGSSVGRTTSAGLLTHTRNRSSLTTLPQTALRTPSLPTEAVAPAFGSSSPKPAPISRYSSSFSNRRNRFSSGAGSKTEDENNSSGKGSLASSAQRGSVTEAEGASSGSVQTDEDNISDFIKLLEQKKELKSFSRTDSASREASMRRTTAALSKYQRMRDSNAVLSDSLSSSLLLHRSSSSSSRQLGSVPPMIGGTSASTSSSPGKPISPHTPHTPAIPSRLSIIDYSHQPHRSRSRARASPRLEEDNSRAESSSDTTTREQGTNAIDIPTSPLPWAYMRRSSSVSQRHRNIEDDHDPYGIRSFSLPVEERSENIVSELATLQDRLTTADAPAQTGEDEDRDGDGGDNDDDNNNTATRPSPPNPVPPPDVMAASPLPSSADSREEIAQPAMTVGMSSTPLHLRSRRGSGRRGGGGGGGGGGGRGNTSAAVPVSAAAAAATATTSERADRYTFNARPSALEDDSEPLLFTMSELQGGAQSRRSVEDGRGGSSSGASGAGAGAGAGAGGSSTRRRSGHGGGGQNPGLWRGGFD